MALDYAEAETILRVSFGKFERHNASVAFPSRGSLARLISDLLARQPTVDPLLPHKDIGLFATASIEMWQRAIHSFLWSVALTNASPIWSSVCGYYASHFVMRAYAHSLGIFKSFAQGEIIQVVTNGRQFLCSRANISGGQRGEHAFYWKAAKDYPRHSGNALFRSNSEKDATSESSHRTFANYTDHVDAFQPLGLPPPDRLLTDLEKIRRIRKHSVEPPTRDTFPDLQTVQILAFQRIVEFQDFLDEKVGGNPLWQAHRRPAWCRDQMVFQVEEQDAHEAIDV
jgi:hypothetical protein